MIYGNNISIRFDCGCNGRFGANPYRMTRGNWISHVDHFRTCDIHIQLWRESTKRRQEHENAKRLEELQGELKDLQSGKRRTYSYSYYYRENPEPYNLTQKFSCGCWFEGHIDDNKSSNYASIVDHKLCDIHIKKLVNGLSQALQEEFNRDLEDLANSKFYSKSEFEQSCQKNQKRPSARQSI